MVPLLISTSIAVSISGGYLAGVLSNVFSPEQFLIGLRQDFLPYNIFFAMIKSVTFAFIITTIPAYYGYNVKGGALEIGKASTTSVVVSCILILIADYSLSVLLL